MLTLRAAEVMMDVAELPFHAMKYTRKGVEALLEANDLPTLKAAVELAPLVVGQHITIYEDYAKLGVWDGEKWA